MNKVFLRNGEFTTDELDSLLDEFPNGFDSWRETHFEMVNAIFNTFDDNALECKSKLVDEIQKTQGTGGLYDLAYDLTKRFELKYTGIMWGLEKDFFDTIDEFVEEELYEKQSEV